MIKLSQEPPAVLKRNPIMSHPISESEFRQKVQQTFDRIEKAFESVDPDVAECEQAMGAMTISFPDRTRCILSTQPSVRQIWLALAAKGTAYHFNLADAGTARERWMDDKGRDVELVSFLEGVLRERIGPEFSFP